MVWFWDCLIRWQNDSHALQSRALLTGPGTVSFFFHRLARSFSHSHSPGCPVLEPSSLLRPPTTPQYWVRSKVCDEFFCIAHEDPAEVTRTLLSWDRFINGVQIIKMVQISLLLDARTLGLQTSLFKLSMKSNAQATIGESWDTNPWTKLWQEMGQNQWALLCWIKFRVL